MRPVQPRSSNQLDHLGPSATRVRWNGGTDTATGGNRSNRLQGWIFPPVELSPARQAHAQGRIPEQVRPLLLPPVERRPPSGPKRAPRKVKRSIFVSKKKEPRPAETPRSSLGRSLHRKRGKDTATGIQIVKLAGRDLPQAFAFCLSQANAFF